MSRVLRSLALMAFTAGALNAQSIPKKFSVTTRLGAVTAERSASLDQAAVIGLDTEYALNKWFGIGTAVDVTRGNTTKKDFLARLRYGNASVGGGDSIYYQYLGQAVSTVDLSLFGTLRYPSKKISPFLMGGVGTYVLVLDPQVNGKTLRNNNMSYTYGGGLWYKLSERVGIQLDARAVTFTKYDRQLLNPARGRTEQITPFPEDFPTPPAAKSTALNTMFTLGFRYIPGGIGGGN